MADELHIHRRIPVIFLAELLHPVFPDMADAQGDGMVDHLHRHRLGGRKQRDLLRLSGRIRCRPCDPVTDALIVFLYGAESFFPLI